MKEQIRQIITDEDNPLQARNLVREYLQARILQFLQESGVFRSWIEITGPVFWQKSLNPLTGIGPLRMSVLFWKGRWILAF